MVKRIVRWGAALTGAALASALACAPVAAQNEAPGEPAAAPSTITATQAQDVLAAVKAAGYEATFYDREGEDSAYIEIDVDGLVSLIFMADCDEAIPDFCETLVLSTKWDRTVPISDAAIATANQQHKYVSVWRDEDGDPLLQWAILTRREGIPTPVFLDGLERYLSVAQDFWDVAFEGDEEAPTQEDEPATDAGPAS